MARVELVKSVIFGMLLYSFKIYSWPVSLLNQIEKRTRNFIWSGCINTRKIVTVSWKNVCRPLSERALGNRSIKTVNRAAMLKLGWDLVSSHCPWSALLRARVFRKGNPIPHHISSSIWSGIRHVISSILENIAWLLGNGLRINFWTQKW